jgi:hypothetical protein
MRHLMNLLEGNAERALETRYQSETRPFSCVAEMIQEVARILKRTKQRSFTLLAKRTSPTPSPSRSRAEGSNLKTTSVLGVVMDAKLKYKEHIARAATKGLEAVMELRRLRGLSPPTARQLFTATVAPAIDYASNVWMHEFNHKAARSLMVA